MPLLAQTHTAHDGQSGFHHEHQEKYTETPLRRGEIIFFVSLPFMLATHMLAGSLLYLGVSGESSLNTMHPGYVGVLLASSVYFSLAIAIHDYQTVKLKTPASAENARDARYVSVSFRF